MENIQIEKAPEVDKRENIKEKVFETLQRAIYSALETYSNVHRGSGYNSMATTYLFEKARDIILEYIGLDKRRYAVIFCSRRRAEAFAAQLDPGSFRMISSSEFGLSMGVYALAVKKNALSGKIRSQAGGGTARLVSRNWVVWAKEPGRYEAGTPAIINIIAFARALQLISHSGISGFGNALEEPSSAADILYHDGLEEYRGKELLDELRKTLIGRNVRIPAMEGITPFINLDNGASTPTYMPVFDAAVMSLRQPQQVRGEIISEVRSVCAGFLDAPEKDFDIFFTSNTTESINIVAESLGREPLQDTEPVVLNTMLEHNSNDLPWRFIPGHTLVRMPVDGNGFLNLTELEGILREYNLDGSHGKKRIRLVAVSGASNILGTFNDLAAIGRIVHKYDARLLVDAAQLVAHRKVSIETWGIDYLAFSAHKVYAPFGSGVLVARKGLLSFDPEEVEVIRASGEENIAGIAALGKVLHLLQRIGMDLVQKEEQELTARTITGLSQIPGLTLYGITDPASPEFARKGGVIVFALKGIMPDRVAKELAARAGIGVRFGCHCSHLLIKHLLHVGPALERFQFIIVKLFPKINLPGLARVSLGLENTANEIDKFIHVTGEIAGKQRVSLKEVRKQTNDFIIEASGKVFL